MGEDVDVIYVALGVRISIREVSPWPFGRSGGEERTVRRGIVLGEGVVPS